MAGLWGESKSALLRQIAPAFRQWVAPFTTVTRSSDVPVSDHELNAALEAMRQSGLLFPIVTKPDSGWQGYGVRLTRTAEALHAYLRAYPGGETMLLQQLVPWDGEAGVFYVRRPGEERGRIESLTFRYFPVVTGDGVRTVRELIHRDERASFKRHLHLGRHPRHGGVSSERLEQVPAKGETVRLTFIGSIRTGGLYYDARAHITPALEERFDAICRSMTEFWFGRFDLRFKSVEQLEKGEDFEIIEINGAGSEAIHVWDPRKRLGEVYRELFRFQSLMFEISASNRARGFQPVRMSDFLKVTWRYRNLLRRYPPSE